MVATSMGGRRKVVEGEVIQTAKPSANLRIDS
jgi:hypothetical protein